MGAGMHVAHHHYQQMIVENAMTAIPLGSYVTAADYNDKHGTEAIKTVLEQHRDPYPSNLQTACYFENDWLDESLDEDENVDKVSYESWYRQTGHFHGCLLPCMIIERRKYVKDEETRQNPMEDDDFTMTDGE